VRGPDAKICRTAKAFFGSGSLPVTLAAPTSKPSPSIGEFWTSGQRKASALHEISYRACFKPQIPAFFIERFTKPGELVYDPFMGRGTTILEALLRGRRAVGNDVNPLSTILIEPRLRVPSLGHVQGRLSEIRFSSKAKSAIDLSMFFHPKTEAELVSLKRYLKERSDNGAEDSIDKWIRMVATNRLTGHSPGFFSVYTLPPNQAVSAENQRRINRTLRQKPTYRNVKELILRKSSRLLKALSAEEAALLSKGATSAMLLSNDARRVPQVGNGTVSLTVTSPPFLDIVNYAADNWLRCWFNGIDAREIGRRITMTRNIDDWVKIMQSVFVEMFRITREGGVVAFEVGEIRKKTLYLEDLVVPMGVHAGFKLEEILINTQSFTKTSNIWGITNNRGGTNTNRIVVFRKPQEQRGRLKFRQRIL